MRSRRRCRIASGMEAARGLNARDGHSDAPIAALLCAMKIKRQSPQRLQKSVHETYKVAYSPCLMRPLVEFNDGCF
jgi:hypothetical protein